MGSPSLNFDSGDGGLAEDATFSQLSQLALNDGGDLLVGERRSVRMITLPANDNPAQGIIRTLAGAVLPGDGPSAFATLGLPSAMVDISPDADESRLALSDGLGGRVRLFDRTAGQVSTLLGYQGTAFTLSATPSPAQWLRAEGDLDGLAYDRAAGRLFASDRANHVLILIDLSAQPSTARIVAGTHGTPGYAADSVAASLFDAPAGLAWAASTGLLYVADSGNHVIRSVDLTSDEVALIAGEPGRAAFFGENDLAQDALLDTPTGLLIGPSPTRADGSLFVADTGNQRVRRIDLDSGLITTVLGVGAPASGGDGAPARFFSVDHPAGMAVDSLGNLFVTSRTAIREVVATGGVPTGDGAVLTLFGAPPRQEFPDLETECLSAVLVLPGDASLLATDQCAGLVLELERATTP
jgi:sugar lactone lactonase YvrE